MAQSAGKNLGQAADQAKDQAKGMADQAKDAAGNVATQVRDAAGNLVDQAKHYASQAGDQIEAGTSAVAGGMKNLAGQLRTGAPHEGFLGNAASTVADGLERGGQYLQDGGLTGAFDDLGTMIRRNPLPAVLAGVGIGFLLGRLMRSE